MTETRTWAAYLLAALSLACALTLLLTAPPRPEIRSGPPPPRCEVVVERPDRSVSCLTFREARRSGFTQSKLPARRALLAEVKLDINRATLDELVALPDIGEGLARTIISSRERAPLRTYADLLKIPGLGQRRIAKIAPFLQPLVADADSPAAR